MLAVMNGNMRRRWRTGPIALLLLLAWAPALVYIDHWPTPELLQGNGSSTVPAFHAHGPAGEPYLGLVPVVEGDTSAASHADHGHGLNGAQGGVPLAVVAPDGTQVAPLLMTLAVSPVVSGPVDGEIHAPPSPPPR